jgi:hypothetical protein
MNGVKHTLIAELATLQNIVPNLDVLEYDDECEGSVKKGCDRGNVRDNMTDRDTRPQSAG